MEEGAGFKVMLVVCDLYVKQLQNCLSIIARKIYKGSNSISTILRCPPIARYSLNATSFFVTQRVAAQVCRANLVHGDDSPKANFSTKHRI